MSFRVRVQAKTDAEAFRTITVSNDGTEVSCDCDGFNGEICAHIDAVLIAQETAMVHPDDLSAAIAAVRAINGRLSAPSYWMASWRKILWWRGLSRRTFRRKRDQSKILVCFTGKLSRPRLVMTEEAITYGFETIDSPSPKIDILVAEDVLGTSAKLRSARSLGIPILSSEGWDLLIFNMKNEDGSGTP